MEQRVIKAGWRRLAALALAICIALGALPSAQAQSDVSYFAETGHYLRGSFRFFWESNGGVQIFGYPITEEYRRSSDGVVVQYFERARFELVRQGDQYNVALGRLGSEVVGSRVFPKAQPIQNTSDRRYFPDVQYIVQYGFKTIWESYGGERIFGKPISNELDEMIEDGQTHTVQYFERVRFEFWPERAPGRRVQISTLGRRFAPPQLVPGLPPNAPPGEPMPESGAPSGGAPAPSLPPVPASVNGRVTPDSGGPGTTFSFSATGFQGGENVGIWLTAPNQATFGAGFQAQADDKGAVNNADLQVTIDSTTTTGIWSFNAEGVSSKRQAIGYFRVTSAGGGAPGNPANLGVAVHDQLSTQGQALIIPVAAPSGSDFFFLGGGFSDSEDVSGWITAPDKSSSPLDDAQISKEGGNVEVGFGTDGLPQGFYTVVVQGKDSNTIAAASFKLTNEFVAPLGTSRPASVNGSVSPAEGGESALFQLRGQGLQPGENLQFWVTAPDGTYVLSPDDSQADGQGRIGYDPPLDVYGTQATLAGVYGFHFRGRSSGVRVDLYLTYTAQ